MAWQDPKKLAGPRVGDQAAAWALGTPRAEDHQGVAASPDLGDVESQIRLRTWRIRCRRHRCSTARAAEENERARTRRSRRNRKADRIPPAAMRTRRLRDRNERNREAHIDGAGPTANREIDPLARCRGLGIKGNQGDVSTRRRGGDQESSQNRAKRPGELARTGCRRPSRRRSRPWRPRSPRCRPVRRSSAGTFRCRPRRPRCPSASRGTGRCWR
jgi:hypothetical protein